MRLDVQPMISAETIAAHVALLASRICEDYAGKCITLLIVLKGGAWFGADLARALPPDTRVEFIRAKSYVADSSSGEVRFLVEPEATLRGRDVLIVEDILDTGNTLAAILNRVAAFAPASLRVCALLDKPARRRVPVQADYVGFEIPDAFVVGYGLDYDEAYRTLPAIYRLVPE